MKGLTMLEFSPEDHRRAKVLARRLGFDDRTVYTSGSALIGLFCLREKPEDVSGAIIKTHELGLMFVQCLADLNVEEEDL